MNLINFITGAHPYLSSAHPEAHHSVRQPPENQEGAGEITGYLCPRGRRHDEYKRLLPCPRERLQLLMRVRKTQWNLFSRWPTPPLLPKKENKILNVASSFFWHKTNLINRGKNKAVFLCFCNRGWNRAQLYISLVPMMFYNIQ